MASKIDVARAYLDKHGTAEPIRTMARKLSSERTDVFGSDSGSVQRARNALNSALGRKASDGSKQTHTKPPGHQSDRAIPASAAQVRDPYVLQPGRWLVQSDHHFPYHDVEAVQAAFDYTNDWDGCLLLGDQVDFHRISRFTSDADAVSTAEELRRFADFLDWLGDLAGGRKIVHKEGNHEERLAHTLAAANSDLLHIEQFRLPNLLDYKERGIDWIGDRRKIHAGHLTLFHGHELDRGIATPVNPAKGLWDKTGVSAVCGHWHRTSEHSHRNAHNKTSVCWTLGCLCDLRPLYAPFNRWTAGFGILELHSDGTYRFENKRIVDGQVY